MMLLVGDGGTPSSGDCETVQQASAALAFWLTNVPPDKWSENLERKPAGQERWRP
jgi:hypothetical protein